MNMEDCNVLGSAEYVIQGGAEAKEYSVYTVAIGVVIVLLLIIAVYRFQSYRASKAKCKRIADAGWIIYYSNTCTYCDMQKRSTPYVPSVECNASGVALKSTVSGVVPACNDPMIKGYPFWYNTKTGATFTGYKEDME